MHSSQPNARAVVFCQGCSIGCEKCQTNAEGPHGNKGTFHGKPVAIRRIGMNSPSAKTSLNHLKEETSRLALFSHPNLLRLIGVAADGPGKAVGAGVVAELCAFSLYNVIVERRLQPGRRPVPGGRPPPSVWNKGVGWAPSPHFCCCLAQQRPHAMVRQRS